MTPLARVDQALLNACWAQSGAGASAVPRQQRWTMDCPGAAPTEGACLITRSQSLTAGDVDTPFTLMSAVKPFVLLRSLQLHGAATLARWLDQRPSHMPYYSLDQLRLDHGRPCNAMVNSGAMLLAAHLPGTSPLDQADQFRAWLCSLAPTASFPCDHTCLAHALDVTADPTNWAIAVTLERAGGVPDAARAHDVYFRLCALCASARQVAQLGYTLAFDRSTHAQTVLDTMRLAGLYEASGNWWAQTQLAAKTAVSGIMFAVSPQVGALAAASRWLDPAGNPIRPQSFIAHLAARAAAKQAAPA
jgi:glutaminase